MKDRKKPIFAILSALVLTAAALSACAPANNTGTTGTMEEAGAEETMGKAGAEEISGTIMKMCEDGNLDRALRMMKKARCSALDELHRSGRKVDCLDFLIRDTEKEMKTRRNDRR